MLPTIECFDHLHVFVTNRRDAESWYARVLGLARDPALAHWATDDGPLTLSSANGRVHLALFERAAQTCRSTLALRVGAEDLLSWREHLSRELGRNVDIVDHDVSWSLYFSDPDGNPYELTTYDYATLKNQLGALIT